MINHLGSSIGRRLREVNLVERRGNRLMKARHMRRHGRSIVLDMVKSSRGAIKVAKDISRASRIGPREEPRLAIIGQRSKSLVALVANLTRARTLMPINRDLELQASLRKSGRVQGLPLGEGYS